jgi:hypothetical protein
MQWIDGTLVVHKGQLMLLLQSRLPLKAGPTEIPEHLTRNSEKGQGSEASDHYANDCSEGHGVRGRVGAGGR